jgi:hypothetical protein
VLSRGEAAIIRAEIERLEKALSRLRKKGSVESMACLPVVFRCHCRRVGHVEGCSEQTFDSYAHCRCGALRIRLRMRTKL